jgi:cytidylate kinase
VKKINIAIDGYSSCGKSTIAKSIAEIINYIYVDTGAMYRAVTLHALTCGAIENGVVNVEKVITELPELRIYFQYNEDAKVSETFLNGVNVENKLRNLEIAGYVSKISTIKEVRVKLVELQQNMTDAKGVVMDGRDIGTVVLPDAELKLFMTADNEVRAKRRFKELEERGEHISLAQVIKNINDRDELDVNRKESPLRQADDAEILDNTFLTIEEQLAFAINLVNKKVTDITT